MCVYVRVCVCERERNRQTGERGERGQRGERERDNGVVWYDSVP